MPQAFGKGGAKLSLIKKCLLQPLSKQKKVIVILASSLKNGDFWHHLFLKIIVILAPLHFKDYCNFGTTFFKGGIYMRDRRSRKRCISYRSKLKGSKLKGSKLKGSKFNRSKRYRRIRGG